MTQPVFVPCARRTLAATAALLTTLSGAWVQTPPAVAKTPTQAAATGPSASGAGVSTKAAAKASTNAPAKAPAKSTKGRKPVPTPEPVAVELPPPEPADEAQTEAADRVFRGIYDCEFKVTITVTPSEKYPSYVDVRHGKAEYLMKPVLSSTGAIRLEDVRGEALMVQISAKSMLLNLRTGHRIADECMSPRQRELMEAKRAARAAEAAEAAASAAAATSAAQVAVQAAAQGVAQGAASAPASAPAARPAASAAMTTIAPLQTK